MIDLHEFARRIPKAELHVHLEGSIQPATLLELARRNGIRLPALDEDGLQAFYRLCPPAAGHPAASFSRQAREAGRALERLKGWLAGKLPRRRRLPQYVTALGCLRTPDDYRLVAYEFGRECRRQNIRYAEVTFSMDTNQRLTGLPWQAIWEALNEGRRQAALEFGVQWGWILDIVRNHPQTQDRVLEMALAARTEGCAALGLGGSEAEFPPDLFVRSFEKARQAGLPRVPHAGEMAGPASVWDALRLLRADRLQHGVRSIEDPRLVAHLVEKRIGIDVCPTSNICLGVYPDYASHPLRQLWDQGVLVTIGSDDPPLFGTSLSREYEILVDHFGFQADELEQVSLNGLRASLLPDGEKVRLEEEFCKEFNRLKV